MGDTGRESRVSKYALTKESVPRICKAVEEAQREKAQPEPLRKPTTRELNAVLSEILKETGIKKTTMTYGKDRGEGARFI